MKKCWLFSTTPRPSVYIFWLFGIPTVLWNGLLIYYPGAPVVVEGGGVDPPPLLAVSQDYSDFSAARVQVALWLLLQQFGSVKIYFMYITIHSEFQQSSNLLYTLMSLIYKTQKT